MNAIIFGASGGIGGALCQAVIASGQYTTVFAVSRTPVTIPGAVPLVYPQFDDESLADIAQTAAAQGPLTLCLSALGTLSDASQDLSPERTLRAQSAAAFEAVFHIILVLDPFRFLQFCPVSFTMKGRFWISFHQFRSRLVAAPAIMALCLADMVVLPCFISILFLPPR